MFFSSWTEFLKLGNKIDLKSSTGVDQLSVRVAQLAKSRGGPAKFRGGPVKFRGGPAKCRGGPAKFMCLIQLKH